MISIVKESWSATPISAPIGGSFNPPQYIMDKHLGVDIKGVKVRESPDYQKKETNK